MNIKKSIIISLASLCFFLIGAGETKAAMTNQISQWGITWHFDKEYEYGTFANGDYWVLGPVTITRITPDAEYGYVNLGSGICTGFTAGVNACVSAVASQYPGYASLCDGAERGTGDCIASYGQNGWEVNPPVSSRQGFQSNGPGFDARIIPDLPYTSEKNESIVKVIASGVSVPTVKTAAVLTVLMEIPPGNGSLVFRPPYVGDEKPLYQVSDIREDLIPSYSSTAISNIPTLQSIYDNFSKCLRMDHHASMPRRFRPSDAMDNYQPKNTQDLNNAMLRFMLDDSYDVKLPAMVRFTQHAIDRAHAVILGYRLQDDGHNPNHRIVAAWAAVLLDIQAAKDALRASNNFHEDYFVLGGLNTSLWGDPAGGESTYWNYIMGLGGSRSNKDPYGGGFIDGGELTNSGASYQNITVQSHKGQVLASRLMPVLKETWNLPSWGEISEYVDRWVEHGVWAGPDPCAPYDGNNSNYRITFGPDSNNPGMCILDPDLAYYNSPSDFACQEGKECGRFPQFHGAGKDTGQYKSAFVALMWDIYGNANVGLPGDFNSDGVVNIFDYNILLQNFGQTDCGNIADLNGDCSVNIFDYNILLENFGTTGQS